MKSPQVIAAVPNYNMAESLQALLPELVEQKYDQVYVLDDSSTDNSVEIAKSFDSAVKVIAGAKNVGSGANRNRILESLGTTQDTLLHFIDADTTLDTKDTPDKAREIFTNPKVVAVGGLVRNIDGLQSVWNWGQRFTPRAMISGMVTTKFDDLARTDPDGAKRYWKRIERIVGNDRPNPFRQPIARPVYWIHEANMMMRANTFGEIGGFDANLRYHDIFPIAIELKKRGLSCHFDPRISVTHKAIDVRNENRRTEEKKAERYLFRKYRFKMFY